jgi:hypothetical protein
MLVAMSRSTSRDSTPSVGLLDIPLWIALAACSGNHHSSPDAPQAHDAAAAPQVTLRMDRDASSTPNPIELTVRVEDPPGTPAAGRAVAVSAAGAALAVVDTGDGTYTARFVPQSASGEVPVVVSLDGAMAAERTALVLPIVGAKWNQPELVPGVVNTPGYEDSVEVSPDDQWLIVSSYSPIAAECLVSAHQPTDAVCQDVVGPYGPPERPGMLGADRIVSATEVHHRCDPLCLTSPSGPDFSAPIPPLASYGFHRQTDDTFAEPFVIGYAADGFTYAQFGFDFVTAPQGNQADLVFAKRPTDSYNEAFALHAALGAPIVLSAYSCPSGTPVESSPIYTAMTYADAPGTSHGNPCLRGGYLWFDNETISPHTISVAPATGTFPALSIGASAPVAIANPSTEDRVQPFFDGDTLYFGSSSDNGVSSAVLSGDPSQVSAWTSPTAELGGEGAGVVGQTNRIAAIGEPSVSHAAQGPARLYFVYVIARGATLDWNIGRVDAR